MLAAVRLRINLGARLGIDEDDRAGGAGPRRSPQLVFGALRDLLGDIPFEDEHSGAEWTQSPWPRQRESSIWTMRVMRPPSGRAAPGARLRVGSSARPPSGGRAGGTSGRRWARRR